MSGAAEEIYIHPACRSYEFIVMCEDTDFAIQSLFENCIEENPTGEIIKTGYPISVTHGDANPHYYLAQNSTTYGAEAEIFFIDYFSDEYEQGVAIRDLPREHFLKLCDYLRPIAGGYIKTQISLTDGFTVIAIVNFYIKTNRFELNDVISEIADRIDRYFPARKKNGWCMQMLNFKLLSSDTFEIQAIKCEKVFFDQEEKIISAFTISHSKTEAAPFK